MKALILAAGRGKRLKPITDHIPKTLIRINGQPILGHILSNLKECGIKDVLIATGYMDEKIRNYVGTGSQWGLKVDYCYNEDYDKTENIYSVMLAEEELLGEDFILINADDLFPPTIISKMMRTPGHIVLAVDGEGTVGSEEMKVKVREGKVTKVTKKMDPKKARGEDIGITKFSEKGGEAFFKKVKDWVERKGPHSYFQKAIDELASKKFPITYINVEGEPWIEIDDHFDLKWAKTPISHMIIDRIKSVGSKIKSIRKKSK